MTKEEVDQFLKFEERLLKTVLSIAKRIEVLKGSTLAKHIHGGTLDKVAIYEDTVNLIFERCVMSCYDYYYYNFPTHYLYTEDWEKEVKDEIQKVEDEKISKKMQSFCPSI